MQGGQQEKVKQMNVRALERLVRVLLRIQGVPHVRPPKPTKVDLERKFVMRDDQSGSSNGSYSCA